MSPHSPPPNSPWWSADVCSWALNVICCKTAIRLESGQKRKWLARTQNGADDPQQTFNSSPLVINSVSK